MKILLVDHTKVFRTLFGRTFMQLGHKPTVVDSGEAALRHLQSADSDLICISLSLQGMDGIALTHRIRSIPTLRETPIVLLTSTQDAEVKQRALEAGVTEIQDRTDQEALQKRLAELVEEHARRINGRVLYIEDSAVMAHAMLKILAELKLEVDHFKNVAEAFSAYLDKDYDLVISDIVVEGDLSGFDMITKVRELQSNKAVVPILSMSGTDDPAQRINLFRRGASDFVTKPIVAEEVKARTTNLVMNKKLLDKVRAQQEYLFELAMVDQVTGLATRNALSEQADDAMSQASQNSWPLSLLVMDLDHFKRVNDTHGHLQGDIVLGAVGEFILSVCRKQDVAARWGGEELILLLPNLDLETARQRAEFIRGKVSELNPNDIPVTVSIGVTCWCPGEPELSFEQLFQRADAAVYEAKYAGRNRVVVGQD
jgi:diguanylate cyclase (GGDEF)-like protein